MSPNRHLPFCLIDGPTFTPPYIPICPFPHGAKIYHRWGCQTAKAVDLFGQLRAIKNVDALCSTGGKKLDIQI